jgi:hypothetical protein
MTVGGSSADWILPDLAGLKQPSSSVNSMINSLAKAKLFGDDPDNSTKYSGTSLRIGSVNQMLLHPSVDLSLAILRGGWSFDSIVSIFTYILKLLVFLAMAGRSLCGWSNIKSGGKAPDLNPALEVLKERQILLINLMGALFSQHYVRRLDSLFRALFATLILYLPDVMADYGAQHIISKQMITSAAMFNLSYDDLMMCSKAIKDDFLRRNIDDIDMGPDECFMEFIKRALSSIQTSIIELSERITRIENLVASLNGKYEKMFSSMDSKLNEILGYVRMQAIGVSHRPSTHSLVLLQVWSRQPLPVSNNFQRRESSATKTALSFRMIWN